MARPKKQPTTAPASERFAAARGHQRGIQALGDLNTLISEVLTDLGDDPVAAAVAYGMVLHHLVGDGRGGDSDCIARVMREARADVLPAAEARCGGVEALADALGIGVERLYQLRAAARRHRRAA